MSILQNLNARLTRYAAQEQQRSYPFGFDGMFTAPNGMGFPVGLNLTMPNSKTEEPDGSFESLVRYAYQTNGIVFACMEARRRLFAQGRFQFQQVRGGTPGDLFGTGALDILEHPEPGKTTGDLLGRMLQDADLAGNSYTTILEGRIVRLRPDWVTIVLGSERDPEVRAGDIDATVLGYVYHPGGRHMGRDPVFLLPEEVAHFAPTADPLASYRGMSWLTPIIRELMADSAATTHKLKFFENSATPNMVVTLNDAIKTTDAFDQWVDKFEKAHKSYLNAYKTLYLASGSTAVPVGANMQQLDFKMVQGAGETRIAAAAGVPPIIVGLSEGLAAATYSNYGQARRAFSDGTMWDLWANVAGSLETLVRPPSGSRLWVDTRHVPFLLEDKKDAAEVQQMQANSIRALVDSGFESDAVIAAVTSGDLDRLTGKHTGLFSVQLQAPGSTKMPEGEAPGEQPVAGTKPAVTVGPVPPKAIPATVPSKRDEEREDLFALLLARSQQAPNVTVNVPERSVQVDVAAAEPAQVIVNVPEQPAPVINVNSDPTPVELRVSIPEQVAPIVNVLSPVTVNTPDVLDIRVIESPPVTTTVKRDRYGNITDLTSD